VSSDKIDDLLKLAQRPVWIVTAASGARRGGLVATFVLQASIDPQRPSVVLGLAPNHFTTALVRESGRLGLHLITRRQIDHVWRFAIGSGRDRDKLAGLELLPSELGVPLVADCLAWFECRVMHEHEAGDRIFFWADVMRAGKRSDGSPLLEREVFELATSEQRTALKADLLADIELQRPLIDAWRKARGGS
jgi:flavin reductase (DIM6/NTAB) family NADH-FMN oxidoreductase RutF